jgi:hypothetical protein
MCNTSPELDMVGVPEEIAKTVRGVLVAPLVREDGAFGAITLYSKSIASYSTEHVRLLESVSLCDCLNPFRSMRHRLSIMRLLLRRLVTAL